MGTNYYVGSRPCEHCGRGDGLIHFMKSFRIYQGWPEDHPTPWGVIRSMKDWRDVVTRHDLTIMDEYGETHDTATVLEHIEASSGTSGNSYSDHVARYGARRDYQDPDGYWFSDAEFS